MGGHRPTAFRSVSAWAGLTSVLAVVAIGGVVIAPKLVAGGSSDPG